MIIKLISKFWTSQDKKRIEGESCLQVLLDYGRKKTDDIVFGWVKIKKEIYDKNDDN